MATQKHKFLRWVCIAAFILAVILLAVAGYSWLTKVWGDQTNTLSAIFSILGTFFSLIGLSSFFYSSRDSRTSSSSQPSQRITINNYGNSSYINTQQSLAPSTADAHTPPADGEPDKRQQFTTSGQQLPQGERSASPLPNAPPTTAPASASSIASGSFPERANKEPAIKLTNQERLNLADALLDAYPNQEDFEMMLEVRCNRKLNTLVDGYSNYRTRIYRLIERTQAEGWTYRLVIAAHEERSLNLALQSWLQKYEAKKVTPGEQRTIPISPAIPEPPQDVQTITAERERRRSSVDPDEQPLAKARRSFREAYNAVYVSKVIFAGRGDIQQIHYLQATAALQQVLSWIQNLQGLLPTISRVDRERLIMDLRRISTEVGESIKHIANYGTLDADQRESERKDTASRLSSVLTHLDNLVGI